MESLFIQLMYKQKKDVYIMYKRCIYLKKTPMTGFVVQGHIWYKTFYLY